MIRDFFIKDLGWKLFSLFLAIMIWVMVHKILLDSRPDEDAAKIRTATYDNLPVQIVSEKSDVRDFRVSPPTIEVNLSGPADVMDELKASQVHATVNLTDVIITSDLHCQVEVSAPPHITITLVKPAKVAIVPPQGQ